MSNILLITGTTNLTQMANADTTGNLIKLGLALILIGLGFKVSATQAGQAGPRLA